MECTFDTTKAVQNQMNKINAEIEKYTQGLPEDEKAYVIEILISVSRGEITPENAFDCIETRFGERARTNAESLYSAAFATW